MRTRDGLKRSARLAAMGTLYLAAWSWVGLEWLGLDTRLRVKRMVTSAGGATPADMIHGTGPKPFVLRTLVPTTVRVLRAAIPESTARRWWLKILRRNPRLAAELPFMEWEEEFLLEYLIAIVVMNLCLLGFVFTMRALYSHLYPTAGWRRDVLPLVALCVLPVFFDKGTHFLYDFATLLFMALGLLLLERRGFAWYYMALVLALLNKETAALLVLVFAVHFFRDMPRARWLAHLAAQAGLVIGVRAFLLFIYRDNPGEPVRWFFRRNLQSMREQGVDVPTLLLFVVLFIAVAARWRSEHTLLKAALVVVPPLWVAYVFVGIYGEIRVFYEMVPAAVIWVFNAGLAAFGAPPSTAAAARR